MQRTGFAAVSYRTYAVVGFGEAAPPQKFPVSRSIRGEAADRAGKEKFFWRGTQRVPGPPNLPIERRLRKFCELWVLSYAWR
jgi:hypothetical protein